MFSGPTGYRQEHFKIRPIFAGDLGTGEDLKKYYFNISGHANHLVQWPEPSFVPSTQGSSMRNVITIGPVVS